MDCGLRGYWEGKKNGWENHVGIEERVGCGGIGGGDEKDGGGGGHVGIEEMVGYVRYWEGKKNWWWWWWWGGVIGLLG